MWKASRRPRLGRLPVPVFAATFQDIVGRKRRPVFIGRASHLFFVPRHSLPEGRAVIEALKQKLTDEAEKLRFELNVTLPNGIRKAVELGDLRENSEYKAALERQQFVQARLGQLTQRLSKLSSIDEAQIATDSVGMGSKVTVEDQDSKEKEDYYLIFGDAEDFEDGQVTMSSPIGRALLGKKVGDVALLKLPARTRKLKVLKLQTIHDED
jgi:transcription elongation factor GreA